MLISGFTIIRNAIRNDYPIVEAICSILPVVDEMVVLIGQSEDDTEALIRSIQSDKLRIYHSQWDQSLREGGKVLAVETDKAFRLINPASDWAFYIQADEVVHEQYHEAIRETAKKYRDNREVDGLLFNYLHFFGTYDYVGDSRRWYHKEVRIIRNDPGISAFRDAQGFRRSGKRINVKPVDAFIYHYGWVKNPKAMQDKRKNMLELWNIEGRRREEIVESDIFEYDKNLDSLQRFTGTHPRVMQDRISRQNWDVKIDIGKKHFTLRERILYWFEKKTGIRPFDFRNYKVI